MLFFNKMCYTNLRFTYLLTYLLVHEFYYMLNIKFSTVVQWILSGTRSSPALGSPLYFVHPIATSLVAVWCFKLEQTCVMCERERLVQCCRLCMIACSRRLSKASTRRLRWRNRQEWVDRQSSVYLISTASRSSTTTGKSSWLICRKEMKWTGAVVALKFWGHCPHQPLRHRVHFLRSPKRKKYEVYIGLQGGPAKVKPTYFTRQNAQTHYYSTVLFY